MSTGHTGDTSRFHWIPRLIKAYAIVDGGTRLALRQEAALSGTPTRITSPGGAADRAAGNALGCHGRNVSVTAVELAGALWHLERYTSANIREQVLEHLARPSVPGVKSERCSFSMQGKCLVAPMRFMACRQLFVAGSSCPSGPGASFPRVAGPLTLLRQFSLRAFSLLLPFYGITNPVHNPQHLEALHREFTAPVSAWNVGDPDRLLHDVQHARLRPGTLAA